MGMAHRYILRCFNVIFFLWACSAFATSPQRIISLSPSMTELVYAVGAGDRLIAVSAFSDYPFNATTLPRISNSIGIDLESLIQLNPDLILAEEGEYNHITLKRLKQLGFKIYTIENNGLQSIAESLLKIGKLTGTEKKAVLASKNFSVGLRRLIQTETVKNKPKVFYELSLHPLMTEAGKESIPEIVKLCGGEPLFSDLTQPAPAINLEAVLALNPDIIITSYDEKGSQKFWQAWPEVSAVKNRQIFYIKPDILQRATPRILKGGQRVCNIIREYTNTMNSH